MLKKGITQKKKVLIPFDFEFEVDGEEYSFTISAYTEEQALDKLDRNLMIIRGDISEALGYTDEEESPETPAKSKVFKDFKVIEPIEKDEVMAEGIVSHPYRRGQNLEPLQRKRAKFTERV